MTKSAFLITIDTEGDNLWTRPRKITTTNARFLPRFQALCEKHGLVPTWLTNYEMAQCPLYREFAHDYLKRRTGELGMHLHAWNSPPWHPLTADDWRHQSYLIEYPQRVMFAKIDYITNLLETSFGVKPLSHRAGRWAFDTRYARYLEKRGYRVDSSVTPGVSWRETKGNPVGTGGTDYRRFPSRPYYLDFDHIDRSGSSLLLEVPVTIVKAASYSLREAMPSLGRRVLDRFTPYVHWLRPNGRNLNTMLRILRKAFAESWPCVTFMLHSSEFLPGGSPTFKTERDIGILYDHLEALFDYARERFEGLSLSGFYDFWSAQHDPSGAAEILLAT